MDAVYGLLAVDADRVGHRGDRFLLGGCYSSLRGICAEIWTIRERACVGLAVRAGKEIEK